MLKKDGEEAPPLREDDAPEAGVCQPVPALGVRRLEGVMFSDESHFELKCGTRVDRCRRPRGSDRFSTKFTRKTVKHPQGHGLGLLQLEWSGCREFLKKGKMMNGIHYRQLLDEKLKFFMHQHQTTHFLQDGAPYHKAKIVTN